MKKRKITSTQSKVNGIIIPGLLGLKREIEKKKSENRNEFVKQQGKELTRKGMSSETNDFASYCGYWTAGNKSTASQSQRRMK